MIASIDLAHTFGTRSDWRFIATQGPPITDPLQFGDDEVPGVVTLCLRIGALGPCDPQLQGKMAAWSDDSLFSERHFLDKAAIVQSHGQPILLVATASLHSGDGNQFVLTQALAYRPGPARFVRVYEHATGKNNNQEVRFIDAGKLAGDIISVDPADTAPFGYWVTVQAFTPGGSYHQVLRYRSATIYGDGNTLPVIDSEMANIQRRLRLWRPGSALPRPATACAKPHLVGMELWCG